MIRIVAAASVLILCASAAALAQGRPDSLAMPCANAAGLVRSAGAIVVSTGPNIYDRYVASRAFCQRDEQVEPRWVAARDTPACFIGYVCERRYGDPASR
jgi:hypothetical protein